MFLDGHREILAEVVRTALPPGFFEGWAGAPSRRKILRAVRLGLAYPDLPCGRMRLSPADGVTAELRRPLLCGVFALTSLFDPRDSQYSELFQSHLGALANVHAMSPSHTATTAEVAATIVRLILAFLHHFWVGAATRRRTKGGGGGSYAFWLGVALHALTDSYSDAHAIRMPPGPSGRLVRVAAPSADQLRVMRHAALLYDLAGRTVDRPLTREQLRVAILGARRNAITRAKGVAHLDSQHQTYLLYLLNRQADREVQRLAGRSKGLTSRLTGRLGTGTDTGTYDIRAFSYYPTQPQPAYHASRDRLQPLRDRPEQWRRMISECAELMAIFREAATGAAANTRSRSASSKDLARSLRRLRDFLVSRPFRLAPGAAARRPMNYSSSSSSTSSSAFGDGGWIARLIS